MLLIITFRPEFEPPWIGRPYVTALTINRLGERDIRAMIDGVVGNKLLPANTQQDIIERADGIPLFVEEMTKAVLEAESEGAAERAIGVVPSPTLAVPASLHGPLMARLDRPGPAKEVAQIGAAIGREFSHTLLAAVVRKPEAELTSPGGLSVVGRELFFATGNTLDATSWSDGEAVFRVSADLHRVNDKRNYFAPSDWKKLDENDEDLGGTNPIPLDVPAPDGSTQALILALGRSQRVSS